MPKLFPNVLPGQSRCSHVQLNANCHWNSSTVDVTQLLINSNWVGEIETKTPVLWKQRTGKFVVQQMTQFIQKTSDILWKQNRNRNSRLLNLSDLPSTSEKNLHSALNNNTTHPLAYLPQGIPPSRVFGRLHVQETAAPFPIAQHADWSQFESTLNVKNSDIKLHQIQCSLFRESSTSSNPPKITLNEKGA